MPMYVPEGNVSRFPEYRAISRINRAKSKFQKENEREPTGEELAEFLDITPDKIGEAISNSARHVSFDLPLGDDSESTLLDTVPDTGIAKTDAGLESESLHEDLCAAMGALSQRERNIVASYERLVQARISGELVPCVIAYRTDMGRTSVRAYCLVDVPSALKARKAALEMALAEQSLAEQYGSQVSDWIAEGFDGM